MIVVVDMNLNVDSILLNVCLNVSRLVSVVLYDVNVMNVVYDDCLSGVSVNDMVVMSLFVLFVLMKYCVMLKFVLCLCSGVSVLIMVLVLFVRIILMLSM